MDEIEKNDGQEIVRDTGTGRFAPGGTLSPERAREIAQARQAKSARQMDAEVIELLKSKGYDPDTAPVEVKSLAKTIVKGGAGLVSALRVWNDIHGSPGGTSAQTHVVVEEGQKCPCCNRYVMPPMPEELIWFTIKLTRLYQDRLKENDPVVAKVQAITARKLTTADIPEVEDVLREIETGSRKDGTQ